MCAKCITRGILQLTLQSECALQTPAQGWCSSNHSPLSNFTTKCVITPLKEALRLTSLGFAVDTAGWARKPLLPTHSALDSRSVVRAAVWMAFNTLQHHSPWHCVGQWKYVCLLQLICDFPSCLQFGTLILFWFNEADVFVLLNALQECTELISNQAVFFLS